jgi:hypothetical protein
VERNNTGASDVAGIDNLFPTSIQPITPSTEPIPTVKPFHIFWWWQLSDPPDIGIKFYQLPHSKEITLSNWSDVTL